MIWLKARIHLRAHCTGPEHDEQDFWSCMQRSYGVVDESLHGAGVSSGECQAALAGGINVMLWHDVTSGICQLQVCQLCASYDAVTRYHHTCLLKKSQ